MALPCSHRTPIRPRCPVPGDDLTGTEYGRALVFLDGPIDFEATAATGNWSHPVYSTPTEVPLTNLGVYYTNVPPAGG